MSRLGCKICNSNDRGLIDSDLLEGLSVRKVAKRYNFAEPTVRRHKHRCLNMALKHELERKKLYSNIFELPIRPAKINLPKHTDKKTPEVNNPIIGATNSSYIPSSYIDIHELDEGIPKTNAVGEWIEYIRNYLVKFIIRCERKGADHLTLLAVRELRNSIELMLRASELMLEQEAKTESKTLIETVTKALLPYRDASIAVANELRLLNG